MDPSSDGCRLCLDLFAERFTTIENPQLKEQMDKVFCFTIEPKQGYSSGVCQSCSFAISEFYQFSEKVRQNQEVLNGNVTNCDPTVDSKISLDNVDAEAFRDSWIRETAEDACESMDEVSTEEVPILDSKITVEDIKIETFNDSEIPESITKNAREPNDKARGEEAISNTGVNETHRPKKLQPKRELRKARRKEDQLFNKHFRMFCNLCEASVETYTALLSHFSMMHKRRGFVVCCSKKMASRGELRDHISWHADPDSFRCETCGKQHMTKRNLSAHVLRMHLNDDHGSFKCDHCPQVFVQKSFLVQHVKWHENIKTKTMLPKTIKDACELQDTFLGVGESSSLASEITIEDVKVETLSDSRPPDTIDGVSEPKVEVSGQELQTLNSEITIENVKIETHIDSELPETTGDACKLEIKVSGENDIPSSGDNESYEPSPKISETKPKGRLRKADQQGKKFFQNKKQRYEEDLIFNQHFRMICDLCGTVAATFTELFSHFWKEHNTRYGYVVCGKQGCNNKLFNRTLVRQHIELHANPNVFRCQVCGIDFKNIHNLNKHMLRKHSGAGSFQCDLCPQSFEQEAALAFHVRRHVKVKCPKCYKTFSRSGYLGLHMTDCGQFACDTCDKEFTSKRSFDRHMKLHMGIEVPVKCQKCHIWVKHEQSLRNHMNLIHVEGKREFQCDICLKNYPHASSLKQHKQLTHSEAQHECEFCGKIFKAKRSLKCHQRAFHTGEVRSGGS